jgi:preprotein translocase subunit YajC
MHFIKFTALLALGQPPTPAGTQPDPKGQLVQTIGMFVIFGVMFYFLMIRPQKKRAQEQAKMLSSVKAGDKILTSSGIIGVVISVKEKSVSIRSSDAKFEITKAAITEITERSGEGVES